MTFQYVNSVNEHKEIEVGSDYSQFIINRHFSYFPDTVMYVAEINQYTLPNESHYKYLFNSIRPKKRFTKWNKKVNVENLELIMKYYQFSENKALDALKVLSDDQIAEIKEIMTRGIEN